ncbi:MAG: hypothetical protein A3I00_07515 [Betaproteobacteria bacterium RIFCSPLOWO2_02_FULL_64_12]|nr:MAG: hypothetical protein A3I00_07515 [Betaproteobacteria bacterium RIFCSPLOWO2_02_FULL_64_12]
MNEQHLGFKIRHYLNQGLALEAGTLARLKAARERALDRRRMAAADPAQAWAGNVLTMIGGPGPLFSRVVVPTAILVLGLIGINYWYQSQVAAEIEEIDAAMLTGDLPIDAYLDKGFDAWLKRSSH